MNLSKPQAPAAPDPTQTIAAQTQSNVSTATANANLNRVDQYTPYGSSTYQITGTNPDGTPSYSQTVALSPQQQQLLNMTQQGEQTLGQTALGTLGNVQNAYQTPFSNSGLPQVTGSAGNAGSIQNSIGSSGNVQNSLDLSGLPGLQSTVNNSGPGITGQVNGGQSWQDAVNQAQNAAYNQQTQYLNPQFAQGQESLNAQLANQGLQVGGQAYDNAQTNFSNQKQQAYQSAQDSAVAAGNAEQNTLYGQGLSSANLQNTANQQGYNQGLSSAQLANAANSQGYTQALGSGSFANTAQQQLYGQNLSSGEFGNTAQQQLYGQNLSSAGLQNSASAQALQQALGLYNQPLNTYNALATGAQVQNPTFGNVPSSNVANTDVAGITNSAYQNQLAAYQQQMAGVNNLYGLGGSLASAAILA